MANKNTLKFNGKTYDLDNMGDLVVNLTTIQNIYCNLVARYLWIGNQANEVDTKKSLKELLKMLKVDINEMYKNIDDNYSFIAPEVDLKDNKL